MNSTRHKKYLAHSLLITSLLVSSVSFSMHTLLFRCSRFIGKGTLPVLVGGLSYYTNRQKDKLYQDIEASNGNPELLVEAINKAHPLLRGNLHALNGDVPVEIESPLRKRIEKINPSLQKIPFVLFPMYAAFGNKILLVDAFDVIKLNRELFNDPNNAKKMVQENIMSGLHETGHIINNDSMNSLYIKALMPIVVEVVSSGAAHVSRKICGDIQNPKTLLKSCFRSSLAIGSIIPKLGLNFLGLMSYSRYMEARADRFAYEHAESREELEAFRDFFRGHQHGFEAQHNFEEGTSEWAKKNILRLKHARFDQFHPYFGDRADMGQKYIDKWDEEHKESIS